MNVDVRALGFTLTPSLHRSVLAGLQRALAHRSPSLRCVQVRLRDVNGPRGGDDKQCALRARFAGGEVVTVRCTRADLYAAIADAMDVTSRRCAERTRRVRDATRRAR